MSETFGYRLVCHFFVFPQFDVICDLLLNRRTIIWNLFVLYKNEANYHG